MKTTVLLKLLELLLGIINLIMKKVEAANPEDVAIALMKEKDDKDIIDQV